MPIIAPPPAPVQAAFNDNSPRFNPFDQHNDTAEAIQPEAVIPYGKKIEYKLF